MAGRFGARLHIFLVLSQVSIDMKGADTWAVDTERFTESDHPLASHLRVARKAAEEIGVTPTLGVRSGMISDEILKEVRRGGHDLLVLGTHRAEDFDTAYEDITDEVLQASKVTTLVVGLRASLF
jgi:nucleotide-binding universal stress UspA family protein